MSDHLFSLAESWLVNSRINLMLLRAIGEEHLAVTHNTRARNVGEQFAHMHNVRAMWLENMSAALAKQVRRIEKGTATKELLLEHLELSGEAMAALFEKMEMDGKPKGGKRGPVNFFAYVIAHEAHHRGQIILHLKYAKVTLPKETGYGIWEWDKI